MDRGWLVEGTGSLAADEGPSPLDCMNIYPSPFGSINQRGIYPVEVLTESSNQAAPEAKGKLCPFEHRDEISYLVANP